MDTSLGEKLNITINLTFHALTCAGEEDGSEGGREGGKEGSTEKKGVCVAYLGKGEGQILTSLLPSFPPSLPPSLPLADVHVDAMDVAGDNQMQVEHNMLKQRLSAEGQPIG